LDFGVHSLIDSFLDKLRGLKDHKMIFEKWISCLGFPSLTMKVVTLTEKVIMSSLRYRLMVPTPLNFLEELLFFIYGDT
jgi:hypothetical protein